MGLLDIIIGWFFFPNSDVARPAGAFLAGAFFFFLRHIVQNGHKWSKNVIYGPVVLKKDNIWSDLIIYMDRSYKWIDHINGSII